MPLIKHLLILLKGVVGGGMLDKRNDNSRDNARVGLLPRALETGQGQLRADRSSQHRPWSVSLSYGAF